MIKIIAQEGSSLMQNQIDFFDAKSIDIDESSAGQLTFGNVKSFQARTAPLLAIDESPTDYQVNGTADFEEGDHVLFTNTPTSDAVRKMALHTRATGTMTFCPTIITSEFARFVEALEAVKQIPTEERKTLGIVGVHVEGRWIDYDKRGIHDPQHLATEMTEHELSTLCKYGREGILKMITISPNIVTPEQIKQLVTAGIVVSIGHSTATSQKVLGAMVAGAQHATHLGNASAGSIEPRDEKSGILNLAFMASGLVPGIPRLISGLICDDGVHLHDNYFQNALHAHGAYGPSTKDIRINITTDNATSPCNKDFSFNFGPGGRMVNYSHQDNTCCKTDEKGKKTLGGAATTMQAGIDRLLRLGVPKRNILHIASGVTRKLLNVKPSKAGTLDHKVLYDRETLQIIGYFQGKSLTILRGQSLDSYVA